MGRQVWAYGDQRMIGGANWTINGLSFDGARIMFNDKAYRIHFLYARPYWTQSGPNGVVSANDPRQNSNASGTDTTLGGTYNSFTIQDTATIDIYALGILRKWRPNTINPVTGLPNESVDDPLLKIVRNKIKIYLQLDLESQIAQRIIFYLKQNDGMLHLNLLSSMEHREDESTILISVR